MQQLSLGPILPLHHVSGPYIYTILSKIKKSHNNPKILVTQSFNIVHCNQNTHKPLCAYIQAFWNTFSLLKLRFFIFCQGELRKHLKFHILLILSGKSASKWLEWHLCRVQGMSNPMPQVSSLCNKQFLKNHNFRQNFHILLILTGKDALTLLAWWIFRFWGMPNPVAFVSSFYNMQFLKTHNFRRHIA